MHSPCRCSSVTVACLVLASAACGQAFSASLEANLPLTVTLFGVSSQPAGTLGSDGEISRTLAGITARLQWTVPTANDLSCSTTRFLDGNSFLPTQFQADVTMWVSGPAGRWGTIEIETTQYQGGWPTVDIFDDGSNDAVLGNYYGSIGSSTLTRRWSIPVQLTQSPLPVRIAHDTGNEYSYLYESVRVRFVPWSAAASDLGSSCPVNHTGWVVGENEDQDYGLTVGEGVGGAAAVLHATGHGQLQFFVIGWSPNRLPVGSIAIGNGCDDLLTDIITFAPGTAPHPFVFNEWTLSIPPLPAGLTLFVQHASLGGSANATTYFGATNVVRYQT